MTEIASFSVDTAESSTPDYDLDSMDLSFRIYNKLSPLVSKHTGDGAKFIRLPFKPRHDDQEGFPGQLLSDYHIAAVTGEGIEDVIMAEGETFYPGFTNVVEAFESKPDLLADIYDKVWQQMENVAIVTEHGEIYDIGLIAGAARVALYKWARKNDHLPIPANHFNTIVGQIIAECGVPGPDKDHPVAALSLLSLAGDVHLSFPSTASMRRANLDVHLRKQRNGAMLNNLGHTLDIGSQLVFFAPSGSRDERLVTRWGQRLHIMQPASRGTFEKLMQHQSTWVLGVSIALDGDTGPNVSMSQLTNCQTEDDCNAVLDTIAAMRSEMTGIQTIYARTKQELSDLKDQAQDIAHDVAEDRNLQRKLAIGAAVGGALVVGRKLLQSYRKK